MSQGLPKDGALQPTDPACTDVPNADRFCVPAVFLSRFVPPEQIVRGDLQHSGNGFDFDIGENTAAVFYAAQKAAADIDRNQLQFGGELRLTEAGF